VAAVAVAAAVAADIDVVVVGLGELEGIVSIEYTGCRWNEMDRIDRENETGHWWDRL
jgi:hypothetical protein